MSGFFQVGVVFCFVAGCAVSLGAESGASGASGDGSALWAAAPGPEEESGLSWQQVMGIVALCGGCCGGGVLWQRARQVRLEPQPLEVKLSREYVSRSEFEEYRLQVNEDFDRVHTRLDLVTPAVAEIKGELKRIAQTQTQILDLLLTRKADA